MCGAIVSGYLIFGIALWSLYSYAAYMFRYKFPLTVRFVYFPIVFTRFRITVYPATVFAPGCPAPAPVSV
jgi:hypothetical protein